MKCVGRKLELVTVDGRKIHPKIMREGQKEFVYDGIEFKELVPCSQSTVYFVTTEPPRDDEAILHGCIYQNQQGETRKPGVLKATFLAQLKDLF